MFEMPTVFVIGAGGGYDLNMPLGDDLAIKISELLDFETRNDADLADGSRQIQFVVNGIAAQNPRKFNQYNMMQAARHISQAMLLAPSIDTFVENYSHDEARVLLSKLAIGKAILIAERNSHLFQPYGDFDMRRMQKTWMAALAQRLFAGVSAQAVMEAFDDVTFINFNYDRCLEVFLVRALQLWFQLPLHEAIEVVRRVKILHPYGTLGSLWEEGAVTFGADQVDLAKVADGLLTYSESVRDPNLRQGIKKALSEARSAIFLGFAFHEPNMKLLSTDLGFTRRHPTRVIASTKNFSEIDTEAIKGQIAGLWHESVNGMGGYIHTLDGGCEEIFQKFGKTMTVPV